MNDTHSKEKLRTAISRVTVRHDPVAGHHVLVEFRAASGDAFRTALTTLEPGLHSTSTATNGNQILKYELRPEMRLPQHLERLAGLGIDERLLDALRPSIEELLPAPATLASHSTARPDVPATQTTQRTILKQGLPSHSTAQGNMR